MVLKLAALGTATFLFAVCAHPLAHPPAPKTAVVLTGPVSPTPTVRPAAHSPAPATPAPLPVSVLIRVPYTPQAPYGGQTWLTHEDYCEAAAILMYADYVRGDRREVIPPAEADARMTPIVQFERRTYNVAHPDLTLTQVGYVAHALFGLTPTVMPATLANVKAEIAAGHPVILPVMTHGAPGGQKLAPYYGYENVYHVLLLKGYDQRYLYTNDAGFMIGENYPYAWYWLLAAVAAQTAHMAQGLVMLVLT